MASHRDFKLEIPLMCPNKKKLSKINGQKFHHSNASVTGKKNGLVQIPFHHTMITKSSNNFSIVLRVARHLNFKFSEPDFKQQSPSIYNYLDRSKILVL